jgi:cell division protein FtsB
MRIVLITLAALLVAIQWPLWNGKFGWRAVWELERQLEAQRATNEELDAHNAELAAELASLREGKEAIEERARMQLNMIRGDEVFFQLVPAKEAAPAQVAQP